MKTLLRYPESLFVVAYFALRPLELVLWTQPTIRLGLIYGVVAPFVALLLAGRHHRARFAAYVFLTMETIRALASGSVWVGCAALAMLLLLQLPRVRAVWPRVDARRVAARFSRMS